MHMPTDQSMSADLWDHLVMFWFVLASFLTSALLMGISLWMRKTAYICMRGKHEYQNPFAD